MTGIQAGSCIFCTKNDGVKLELVVYVHIDGVFMEGRLETLENIKKVIKLKFNIKQYGKAKKFLGVYYK